MNDRNDWITPQRVHKAMARLHDRDRAIIERRCSDGWTYAAIGSELGISREKVRQRMGKALYRLRCAVEVVARQEGGRRITESPTIGSGGKPSPEPEPPNGSGYPFERGHPATPREAERGW